MKFLLFGLGIFAVLLIGAAFLLYTPDESRAALEAKYHVSASDYVQAAGVRLRVADSGPRDAPVIILLHGFGASLDTFDAWAKLLSRQYRVIRPDLPGFGLTGPDPTGDYSDARSMAVLAAMMDRLGVQRADFVGNSMGGRIAWMFAAAYPSRVDRLVLTSPDGFASEGFAYGVAPGVPMMLRLLPYTMPKAMLRMTLAPAYADPKRLSSAVETRYWDFMRAPGVRRAVIARTAQTVLQDPLPLLRRIQAPTLLLWGEEDAMIPISNAADYLAALPHATLVRLPGLGHVPFEESPETSLAPVLKFLSEQ
jgi:pimeloyl-ACP methyl ester carboxylesterase